VANLMNTLEDHRDPRWFSWSIEQDRRWLENLDQTLQQTLIVLSDLCQKRLVELLGFPDQIVDAADSRRSAVLMAEAPEGTADQR
jgi:hypothetical protein